ncbi:MAG TPA: ChbG/HpnK family deacetylase [Verrucomicrobiae bacterium]|nr:ChbG/HpnK family deacetylase [Verrucomicrobiae bacterium]
MNETLLIVNADDLGMSRGVTDGILLAFKHGILTSASLMANMPAAEYALGRLESAPGLGVGCHLNICQGWPLLPRAEVPTLVGPSGCFHPPAEMARRLWRFQVNPHEIEAEFREQIRWMKFRRLFPTHADSHHHMHLYPAAALPFARALAREHIPCARTSRCSVFPRSASFGGPHEGGPLRRVLVGSYRAALQSTVFRRLLSPDCRIAFVSRDRNNLALLGAQWRLALWNLPSGAFELACHPGMSDPREENQFDAIRAQREQELCWLLNSELRDIIAACGIRLITYDGLRAPAAVRTAAARVAAA